jgi:hypothetical protein
MYSDRTGPSFTVWDCGKEFQLPAWVSGEEFQLSSKVCVCGEMQFRELFMEMSFNSPHGIAQTACKVHGKNVQLPAWFLPKNCAQFNAHPSLFCI